MNQEVFYSIIKNNPEANLNEIKAYAEFCDENNITESKYGFKIWLLDKGSHKIVFKGVMSLNNGDNKMKYVVAQAILNDQLLIKAMGGDLPGDFIPTLLEELYYAHEKRYEGDADKKEITFICIITPKVALSSMKIIKSKNMLEVKEDEYIGGFDKDTFIISYYNLLREDCKESLINEWLNLF